MKKQILTSAILAAIAAPIAAHADSVGAWSGSDSVTSNISLYPSSGAYPYGSTKTAGQGTGGVVVATPSFFGYAWTADGSGASSDGGVIGAQHSWHYHQGVTLKGALSVGYSGFSVLSHSAGTPALGFDLSVGQPLMTVNVRERAIKVSSNGESVSAPLIFGAKTSFAVPVLKGRVGLAASLIQPVFSLSNGSGISPGYEVRATFSAASYSWVRGASLSLSYIGGEHIDGNLLAGEAGGAGNAGLRDAAIGSAWPILPGDPASSYQRGFFATILSPVMHGWQAMATLHISSPGVQTRGQYAGGIFTQSFSSSGLVLGVSKQF